MLSNIFFIRIFVWYLVYCLSLKYLRFIAFMKMFKNIKFKKKKYCMPFKLVLKASDHYLIVVKADCTRHWNLRFLLLEMDDKCYNKWNIYYLIITSMNKLPVFLLLCSVLVLAQSQFCLGAADDDLLQTGFVIFSNKSQAQNFR